MDFFSHQEAARRRTRVLVGLYAVAVALIILAVYGLIAFGLVASNSRGPDMPPVSYWNPDLFIAVAIGLLALIGGGTLYKVRQLSQGGDVVAHMLGGRRLDPSSASPAERRLLNVVEEMAIASGTPVPPVYVLEEEGINAFAAGLSPADAIIGVTRGCVETLSRDELQGVVAHEFSHILNGDMRLNLKLMGVLHGILLIALTGYFIFRSSMMAPRSRSRNDKGDGGRLAILALGAGLMLIGSIGIFFSRLIKSAVSRQREFLADASAVQFTRNPSGIAGALRRIGGYAPGSRIQNHEAEVASHLFFANSLSAAWFGLMATHPPLEERIRRIDASVFAEMKPVASPAAAGPRTGADERASGFARGQDAPGGRLSPESVTQRVGAPTSENMAAAVALLEKIPDPLRQASREPELAVALICALLMDPSEAKTQARQKDLLHASIPDQEARVARLVAVLRQMSSAARLPLFDLALSTLRTQPPETLRQLDALCAELIMADGKITLFEHAAQRMLRRMVEASRTADPADRQPRVSEDRLMAAASLLLATLAREGAGPDIAYASAMRRFLPGLQRALPPPAESDAVLAALRILEQQASPAVKRRFLAACAEIVIADGQISQEEGDMLRAVSAALNCPMPLFA